MYSSVNNTESRLTIDGVQTVANNAILPGQQLILQLLQTQTNYLGYYYSELSDGYAKIKCELREKIKQIYEQEHIKEYSVVSFAKEDIQVTGTQERVEVVVKNCTIVNSQVTKLIGKPMPYILYANNKYQNPKGSNEIDITPKHYTIRQIIMNTRLKNAYLKGKVTKLPDNVGKGLLCFMVQDEENKEIQCVCYEQIADQIFPQLRAGGEYLFTGFILQKNRRNNDDELKFRKEFKVIPVHASNSGITGQGNTKSESNLSNDNNASKPVKQQNVSVVQQETNQSSAVISSTAGNKCSLVSYLSQLSQDQNASTLFTLQGKVSYLFQKQKPKYKKINIMDNNEDIIDIMLWSQVPIQIEKQKTYQFTFMRIKQNENIKNGNYKYIELHSTKRTVVTQINPLQMITSRKQMQGQHQKVTKYDQHSKNIETHEHKQNTKKLPDHLQLNTLTDLLNIRDIGIQAKDKLANPYPYVECTLKFRTQGFNFNHGEDQMLNYFSFYCGACNKTTTAVLSENNVVSCNRCKRDDVMIKWGLRVKLFDFNFQLPCCLQNQATQRLLNMKAYDGFVLYHRQFNKFQTLLHKVNFQRRVCKLQIRNNNGNQYYNVLQVYAKESKSQVYRALKRLKDRMKQYQDKDNQQKEPKTQSIKLKGGVNE